MDIKLDPLGYDDNAYTCRREFDAFPQQGGRSGHNTDQWSGPENRTGTDRQGPYTIHYADYSGGGPTGNRRRWPSIDHRCRRCQLQVAKAMDAGEHVAIAFQEWIKLPAEEMTYYEDLAEMYVGTDVSTSMPAFPK